MLRTNSVLVMTAIVAFVFFSNKVHGQFGGSRGGTQNLANPGVDPMPALNLDVVQGFITVDGRAEIRVKPTSIRIVIAVTGEAETPQACQASVDEKISALKAGFKNMQIADKDVVDDFIAVLPRYEFDLEERAAGRVAVEKRTGFIMQSNLHIAVKNDEQAMQAIRVAFAQGVSDIIAFDYWNDQIDEIKKQARVVAIKAAKEKSETLLAVFDKRPPLINISESTEITYPQSLYQSFDNSNDENFYSSGAAWRDTPVIRTFRPKNTYYRGLYSDGDVQPAELPLKSEISVTSSVKLYYESPVAKEYAKLRAQSD